MIKNKHNAAVSDQLARRLLRSINYVQETGEIFWRERPEDHFKSLRAARVWNSMCAGKLAFDGATANGYLKGGFEGRELLAHRVAWLAMNGSFPCQDIDHINGDRSDNRILNLREVSRAENMKNKGWSGNRCGAIGVYKHKFGRFAARIQSGGKRISLGYFDTIEDASGARRAAEIKYGFHANHGRPL